MELDDPVCLCFRITKRKLLHFVRREQPRVASQLSQCGGAGTGCGWCIPYLIRLHAQNPSDLSELETLTIQDYVAGRKEHIRTGKGTPPSGATPSDKPGDDSIGAPQ
jgi:bacterioferritin-associated ferredoxin